MKLVVAPENPADSFVVIPVGGKIQVIESGVYTIKRGGTLVFVERKTMNVVLCGKPLHQNEYDSAFLLAMDQFNKADQKLKKQTLSNVAKKSRKSSKKVNARNRRTKKAGSRKKKRGK